MVRARDSQARGQWFDPTSRYHKLRFILTDINKIKKAFKNSISIDLNNHISNHWKWFLDKKEFDFDQLQNFRNNDLSKYDDSNYINEKSFKILVKKILEIIDKNFFKKFKKK